MYSCYTDRFSATELRVMFSPPSSDSGDTVTSYMIEYSTSTDFRLLRVIYVLLYRWKHLENRTGLTNGVLYYVHVSAKNSEGYGSPSVSSSSSLNPYQQSGASTICNLRVTSQTMLTVSPLEGGDAIT